MVNISLFLFQSQAYWQRKKTQRKSPNPKIDLPRFSKIYREAIKSRFVDRLMLIH